jgi:hypothetical protein
MKTGLLAFWGRSLEGSGLRVKQKAIVWAMELEFYLKLALEI